MCIHIIYANYIFAGVTNPFTATGAITALVAFPPKQRHLAGGTVVLRSSILGLWLHGQPTNEMKENLGVPP